MDNPQNGWELLPASHGCFVCDGGGVNPRSLKLKIYWNPEGQSVHIPFTPDAGWCGYSEVVHGGLIAATLDEAMAWAVRQAMGEWAFTVDFHLRYKKAVEPGRAYQAVAAVQELGRKITASARLLDAEGQTAAVAEGIFLSGKGRARQQQA